MQEITSTSNQRLKFARKLQRKRARAQSGLCLLEGLTLVQDALSAGVLFDCVFADRHLAAQTEVGLLLATFEEAGVQVLLMDAPLLAEISDTVTPQGVVAVAHIPAPLTPDPHGLVLVLDGVGDPGNAGTLLRSAAAAGVDAVIFGPETVDAFSSKVLRAGMGAHFRIKIVTCLTWAEVEVSLGDGRLLYVANATARMRYDQVDWRSPSALVIGSESRGPSQWARSAAVAIAIPMQRGSESLNAAMAGSIILFEAARQHWGTSPQL